MSYRLDLTPSPSALVAAAELRRRVFTLEQGVDPAIERDGLDDEAQHVVVYGEGGVIVGTGRIMLGRAVAKVQRVAVDATLRGQGVGRLVMRGLETLAVARGVHEMRLSSQDSAVHFYERLGYLAQGAPYMEAGIVHRAMSKTVGVSA